MFPDSSVNFGTLCLSNLLSSSLIYFLTHVLPKWAHSISRLALVFLCLLYVVVYFVADACLLLLC